MTDCICTSPFRTKVKFSAHKKGALVLCFECQTRWKVRVGQARDGWYGHLLGHFGCPWPDPPLFLLQWLRWAALHWLQQVLPVGVLSLVCVTCCLPLTSSIIDTKTWDAEGSIRMLKMFSFRGKWEKMENCELFTSCYLIISPYIFLMEKKVWFILKYICIYIYASIHSLIICTNYASNTQYSKW